MPAQVFLSHSSKDHKIAGIICSALEARGIKCWIANRDVGPGENFQEAIVRAIRSVKIMVLVFTNNANNSAEIKKELALASQHSLTVIPARAEDVIPSEALAYELSTRQWINLFGDWENEIQKLSARLQSLLLIPSPVTDSEIITSRYVSESRRPTQLGGGDTSSSERTFPRFAMVLLRRWRSDFSRFPSWVQRLIEGINAINATGLVFLGLTTVSATSTLIAGIFGYLNRASKSVLWASAFALLINCFWFFVIVNGELGSATIFMAISTMVYTAVCIVSFFYFLVEKRTAKRT
jgi:uncharacterized membrane protein